MKAYTSLLFMLLLLSTTALKAQFIEYTGRVVNKDFEPISGALIRISGTGLATSSNDEGKFFLPLRIDDSLIVSHIGYLPEIELIRDIDSSGKAYGVISLNSTIYELKTVDIFPWPETYLEFKKAFVQLEIEDEKIAELNIPGIPKNIPALSDDRYGISASGPIQLAYNLFSKSAKRKKAFLKNIKREKYYDRISLRYNRELVARISGLSDPAKIDSLMKYCSLKDKFILKACDYDIYFAILNCLESWEKKQKTDSIPMIH